MARRTQTFQAILEEVARGGDRSPLFWFLVQHHDELLQQAEGRRLRWDALCQRFAQHGLTDARGETANPKTARQTWLRARKAVVEAKRRKQVSDAARRPGDVYPSRISPDWRPTIVSGSFPGSLPTDSFATGSRVPAVAASPAPTAQPQAPSSGPVPSWRKIRIDPNLPEHARAEIERVLRDFDEIEDKRLKL